MARCKPRTHLTALSGSAAQGSLTSGVDAADQASQLQCRPDTEAQGSHCWHGRGCQAASSGRYSAGEGRSGRSDAGQVIRRSSRAHRGSSFGRSFQQTISGLGYYAFAMTGRRIVAIGTIFLASVLGTVEAGTAASHGSVSIGGGEIDGGSWNASISRIGGRDGAGQKEGFGPASRFSEPVPTQTTPKRLGSTDLGSRFVRPIQV